MDVSYARCFKCNFPFFSLYTYHSLFDDDQGNDYLCNLRNKTYKKFILPKKFRDDTQMYLAGKEKKMLVQHGKEIYLNIVLLWSGHPIVLSLWLFLD